MRDKLDRKINNVIMEKGRDPKFILMHPKTFNFFCEIFFKEDSHILHGQASSIKYRGIRILRCLDLPKGEFELTF